MSVKREVWRPTRRDVVLGGACIALCALRPKPAFAAQAGEEYLKVFSFVTRKTGMTHDECVRHWIGVHGPIARKVPGVHGFVASELIEPREVTEGDAFDGVALIWYRANEPVQQTLATPEGKAWLADGDTFIQRERSGGVAGREHALVAPRVRAGAVKRMDFLVRKAGLSAEQFQAECLALKQDIVKGAAGLQGLAITQMRPVERPRFVFDAVVETWWADDRGNNRAPAGVQSARALLDSIADAGKSVRLTVRDHVFVAPPG
jgi:uncharacterized protein (TIGR02118 family)